MIGVQINNGFLDFSKIDFSCPRCTLKYIDDKDIYLNRINKNKSGITHTKCKSCNRTFGITYNFKNEIVSFL